MMGGYHQMLVVKKMMAQPHLEGAREKGREVQT
jgi:hypothetical protein